MNPGGGQALGPLAMMVSWCICLFLGRWVRSRSGIQAVISQRQLSINAVVGSWV